MRGVASAWPAYTLWRGPGGLQHLKKLAGAAEIQVMCSDSGVYHGDMRSHSPTCCTFAEFLDSADPTASTSQQWGGQQVYLAQAPLRTSAPLPCSLTALQQDVGMPPCLKGQAVSHVNLWMSTSGARSSLHNDPYQNLLCVVRGRKAVTLFSPAMTPWLYPMPIWGESPNHSAVNFAAPDLQQHPLYAQALLGKQVAVLEAGDALFIPEGWWHQIDSAGVTMAVNFWWDSPLAALAGTPADAYCLRRLMGSLLDSRKQQLLAQVMPFHFHTAAQAGEPHGPALDPLPLRRVLLALAEHFPRSLSVLLMHGLTPAAAELLTGRFEAADAQLVEQGMHQEQQSFYSRLYSVVDDPQQVLEVMLARKEEFAAAICKQLIQEVLGVPYA
ncbi:hypothetical protein WJX72_001067 [[Myrmecia] bisecta]|uniref:JmjC domain-containing protein n=1 Tax=[Myrmecia] bisecta TaxID=41462 RepID=A0AAW1QNV1_9CHLO